MATECTLPQLRFHAFGRRDVISRFDGERITSDGAGVLVRETDLHLDLVDRLAGSYNDHRNANCFGAQRSHNHSMNAYNSKFVRSAKSDVG